MTEPKKVSDFAKEYEQMYIANVQLNSVIKIMRDERDQLQKRLDEALKQLQNLNT